jgi:CheY-like chemotaxis protein
MVRLRVLLVEDDSMLRFALRRDLSKWFDVVSCEGGDEALELLRAGAVFDALVVDIVMPQGSGEELYNQLSFDHLPRVIFITAGVFTLRYQTFLERVRPDAMVLEKPFEVETLKMAIESVATMAMQARDAS